MPARISLLLSVLALSGCATQQHPHDYYADQPWVDGTTAKVLFPVQLAPDVAVHVVWYALSPVTRALGIHPCAGEPDSPYDHSYDRALWPVIWLLFPISGAISGGTDAWHGYGFWQPWAWTPHRDHDRAP